MLRFFRHIRKKLIEEDNVRKYLLYAIGEIILVVIGILIALQINNWNNNQIEKEAEIKTLIELRKGILMDADLMQNSLNTITSQIEKMKAFKMLLNNEQYSYDKGLDTLFGSVYGVRAIRVNKAFYEDLKASSLKLIKDDAIRLKIVNLFEDNYVLLDKIFEMEIHINDITRPYYLKNFHNIDFHDTATPNNYREIWTDKYYHNVVHYRIINLESNHISTYNQTIPKINELANLIENYLNLHND